jgi:type VI secretion system protein ImpC
MAGRLDFDLTFGPGGRRREEGEPMRLLVLGDFSGRPPDSRPLLPDRQAYRVDIDNLDVLVRRLEPRVTTPAGELRFQQMDDFHPDRLYERGDRFRTLREARGKPPPDDDDQLARLLGKPAGPSEAAAPKPAGSALDALIRDAVAPHIVKDTAARTTAYVAAVDAAIALEMRKVLHDPAFQPLEAAWRGVGWLISNLELDENLQLYLFDVTREELLADLVSAQGKPGDTGLHRAVVDRSREGSGRAWSALVGLFQFGDTDADVGLLAALAAVASRAGGPLLADADLALGGAAARESGWPALRRSEAARWIGLAAPRVLLRLPYGRSSDPIEAFAFEELVGAPGDGELLWGNASLAMALLIGRAFTARGWEMEPGDEREIGDLPAYTFVRDGERQMQPCAERLLSERDIDTYLKSGLVPIASRRDRNSVVAVRFQSVADPPAPLAW